MKHLQRYPLKLLIEQDKYLLSCGFMTVDCVGSADGTDGLASEDLIAEFCTSLWMGREVKILTEKNDKLDMIRQFYVLALQQIENLVNSQIHSHLYDLLDLEEEIFEELSLNFEQYAEFASLFILYHPLNREFILADPIRYQAEITKCKNIFKAALKSVGKCARKVAKGVKKGAEEVAHFVKDHKKEILIGAALVAAAAGAFIIAGALSGSAAGAGAVDGTNKKREDEDESPVDIETDPISSINDTSGSESSVLVASSFPAQDIFDKTSDKQEDEKEPLDIETDSTFSAIDISSALVASKSPDQNAFLNPFPTTHNSVPDLNVPLQSAIASFMETLGNGVKNALIGVIPKHLPSLLPSAPRSCRIQTEGIKYLTMRIGFINGMNTSLEEYKRHLDHIKRFTGDMSIEGVYNRTHHIDGDLSEIFLLNYAGIAPVTANLLLENWTQFHEDNKDNPDAKYLQFTHSMGTILAKDSLQRAPQEIRDRVIIVALGPAVVIPEGLCYQVFHYASKKDIVHYGEDVFTHSIAAFNDEPEREELIKQLIDNKQQITFLDPHSEAKGIDHEFQSPTFHDKIDQHIQLYLEKQGQY